jgi:hypothetical protein
MNESFWLIETSNERYVKLYSLEGLEAELSLDLIDGFLRAEELSTDEASHRWEVFRQ